MIKPWTSRPAIIDAVLGLFDATAKAAESPSARSDTTKRTNEPHSQLPALAAIVFACIQEQLDWLGRYAIHVGLIFAKLTEF